MNAPTLTLREAHYPADADLLRTVRHAVFILEQSVPESLEWAGDDEDYRHFIALDANQTPIGTGRISPQGKIGRMAVLKSWRGQGVGSAILEHLINVARADGCPTLTLSAQLQARPFYSRHGFLSQGDIYQEAGIDHVKMERRLTPQ